jgi:hypothetical protein
MNLRLTPLNIVSSLLLVSTAYLLIYPDIMVNHAYPGSLSLLLMFVLCFVSDIVFRRLIRDIKRIWLFELLFIIFVSFLILLIRSVFN